MKITVKDNEVILDFEFAQLIHVKKENEYKNDFEIEPKEMKLTIKNAHLNRVILTEEKFHNYRAGFVAPSMKLEPLVIEDVILTRKENEEHSSRDQQEISRKVGD